MKDRDDQAFKKASEVIQRYMLLQNTPSENVSNGSRSSSKN